MSLYTTLNRLFSKVSTSLNGIKTGWDGTQYETVGEAVRQQISDLHNLIENGSGGGSVPSDVRTALSTLLQAGAYTETGLTNEMNVVRAWAETVTGITLSAETINVQDSTPVQLTATTEPSGRTVSWRSLNPDIATVSNTGLVTGVNNGNAVIVASSGDISARCTATVTGFVSLTGITATYTQSGTVYDTVALSDLTADLVVTATYSDSSTAVIPSTDYTLSGTLEVGTSTITVSYAGKTATFNVVVSEINEYSMSNGLLVKVDGGTITDDNSPQNIVWQSNNTKRRTFYVENGTKPVVNRDARYAETNYYPIPIPASATQVTVSITPATQFHGEGFWTYTNGVYTRTYDPGWKQGSFTHTFEAGTYDFLTTVSKYDSSGNSYPVEPTDLVVEFE